MPAGFVLEHAEYHSETVLEERAIDTYCAGELLHNSDVTRLPVDDLCAFIERCLRLPLRSSQDLRMSMELYWLYCMLAILSPQRAKQIQMDTIDALRSWIQDPPGLVLPHPGYPAHTLITFGTTLLLASLGQYDMVQRQAVHAHLKDLFNDDLGCFCVDNLSRENDMRVSYTCVVVGYCYNLLDDKTLFGDKLISYFMDARAYDGGFCSSGAGGESHAAYTFCGLASLYILLGCSSTNLRHKLGQRRTMDLLVYINSKQTRQGGFAGRNNKLVDGCYTYWVMGSLYLLVGDGNIKDFMVIDADALYRYVLCCSYDRSASDGERGLRDKPGVPSDAYHNMYVTAGYLIMLRLIDLDKDKSKYSKELLDEVDAQREVFMRHDPLLNIPVGSADSMRDYFSKHS